MRWLPEQYGGFEFEDRVKSTEDRFCWYDCVFYLFDEHGKSEGGVVLIIMMMVVLLTWSKDSIVTSLTQYSHGGNCNSRIMNFQISKTNKTDNIFCTWHSRRLMWAAPPLLSPSDPPRSRQSIGSQRKRCNRTMLKKVREVSLFCHLVAVGRVNLPISRPYNARQVSSHYSCAARGTCFLHMILVFYIKLFCVSG